MADQALEMIFRNFVLPDEGGCPKLDPRTEKAQRMIIEFDANKGQHVIHTGGRYDSHLLVPVIPER